MTLWLTKYLKAGVSSNPMVVETQRRIDAQILIVETMQPGSEGHRLSTGILLALADSMLVLIETQRLLREIEAQERFWSVNAPSSLANPAPTSN